MNTEEEYLLYRSNLHYFIRFAMLLFITLNVVVSIATLVVQIKVSHSKTYIEDTFSDLGFHTLGSIYNLLPILSVSSYISTAIGYFFVISYFFFVYKKNHQELFDGIKARVILFVVLVEAIMISRSVAYMVINFPCEICAFCPTPK